MKKMVLPGDRVLIGIAGLKGSGKNTVCDIIKTLDNRFIDVAFADPIKAGVRAMFGSVNDTEPPFSFVDYPKEKKHSFLGFSLRDAYEGIGHYFGRKRISKELWINLLYERIDFEDFVVITDVRYVNEAQFVNQEYGFVINVIKNKESWFTKLKRNVLPRLFDGPEYGIPDAFVKHTIVNDGSLYCLEQKVKDILIKEGILVDTGAENEKSNNVISHTKIDSPVKFW